jgi:predicted flap endonuclease-1-like 5' DNA nuclease
VKRVLGFAFGVGLSVGVVYGLRRFLNNMAGETPVIEVPTPAPPPSPRSVAPVEDVPVMPKPNVRIHRSGMRPPEPRPTSSPNGSTAVVAAGPTVEQAVASETVETVPAVEDQTDDFTSLKDIGPAFNQKLHEAGIKTFEALATLSVEEIADKIGIPVERIERNQWREQAAEQAKEKKVENS